MIGERFPPQHLRQKPPECTKDERSRALHPEICGAAALVPTPLRTRRPARGEDAVLKLLGYGFGGVEELASKLNDKGVSWALLKFQVGSGTFLRTKLVSVHCNGEKTPAILRGLLNSHAAEASALLGKVHAGLEVTSAKALSLEYLCERLLPVFAADHLNSSPLHLRLAYKKMIEKAKEAAKACEAKLEEQRRRGLARVQGKASLEALSPSQHHLLEQLQPRLFASPCPPAPVASAAPITNQVTAMDALALVAADRGIYNWVLLEPRALAFQAAGSRGLEEMILALDEEMVLFGALRLSFGSCWRQQLAISSFLGTPTSADCEASPPFSLTPSITKHVFIHWVGSRTGIVQRGRWNARLLEARRVIESCCAVNYRKTAHCLGDLSLEELLSELRRLTVTDSVVANSNQITKQAYLAALQEEERVRQAAAAAAITQCAANSVVELAGDARVSTLVEPMIATFETERHKAEQQDDDKGELEKRSRSGKSVDRDYIVELRRMVDEVRAPSSSWNWVACGFVRPEASELDDIGAEIALRSSFPTLGTPSPPIGSCNADVTVSRGISRRSGSRVGTLKNLAADVDAETSASIPSQVSSASPADLSCPTLTRLSHPMVATLR